MKRISVTSIFFGLLAAGCMAAAVWVAAFCQNRVPVLLAAPQEATAQVEAVMEAICSGDFDTAEKGMHGSPDLGMDGQPEGTVNKIFWNAFVASLDYELVGDLYATQTGVAQDVKIISLEIPAATENLSQRAQALLQQGMDQAEDVSEIYDEKNGYKESFVNAVMEQAAKQALEEDARYSYQTVTLQLVYEDDQWWVTADRQLLSAISGGTVG